MPLLLPFLMRTAPWLIGAAVIATILAGAYAKGHLAGTAKCESLHERVLALALQEQAVQRRKEQEASDAQARTLAALLAKQMANNRILKRSLDNVLAANPTYRSCHIGLNGLRAVHDAVTRSSTDDAPGGSAPTVRPP